MTQAPAEVVRSLEPLGDLQLHRLDRRVRIHCVLCQRNRTHDRVATRNRDWAQPVCIACYAAAFRVQRDGANSAAKENKRQHREAYAKVSLKKYKPMAARNEDRNVSSGLL